jgi:hypothetical protein
MDRGTLMEHADARELLEIAAVEPDGLGRLTAGDTPEAAALAGHLAGCASCAEEMARLRRVSAMLRGAIATMPPAELRGRTLSFVRDVGVARPLAGVGRAAEPTSIESRRSLRPATAETGDLAGETATALDATPSATVPSAPAVTVPAAEGRTRRVGGIGGRAGWLVAAAASLVIVAGATGLVVSSQNDAEVARLAQSAGGLARSHQWALRLSATPDVRRIDVSSNTANIEATLLFSKMSREMVIVATGLTQPPEGKEYRCWFETAEGRQRVGRMFFGGNIAYWAGDVDLLATVKEGTPFGVSLVDVANGSLDAPPVVSGSL